MVAWYVVRRVVDGLGSARRRMLDSSQNRPLVDSLLCVADRCFRITQQSVPLSGNRALPNAGCKSEKPEKDRHNGSRGSVNVLCRTPSLRKSGLLACPNSTLARRFAKSEGRAGRISPVATRRLAVHLGSGMTSQGQPRRHLRL